MPKRVLVCSAHPDDEVLGCGGTIARHVRSGDEVHVVILGQGIFARGGPDATEEALSALRTNARSANRTLGVRSLQLLDFPDQMLDTIPRLELNKAVENAIAQIDPHVIYTHFIGDLNADHRRVSEAVCVAARPAPESGIRSVRFFEVQSSTEWRPAVPGTGAFAPNLFIDVSETLELKLSALRAYETEMRPWPHARSLEAIEHLARWRGATVGVQAAEAFVLHREVLR